MSQYSALLTRARTQLHRELVEGGTLSIAETADGRIASNADKSQKSSRQLSLHVADQLHARPAKKRAGQTAGAGFEEAIARFVAATFPQMQSVRPGEWVISNVGSSRKRDHIERYEPYTHLADLAEAVRLTPPVGGRIRQQLCDLT